MRQRGPSNLVSTGDGSLCRALFLSINRTSKLSKTIYSRLVIAMDLADDIRAQKEIQVQFLDLVILINDASSCS